MVKIKAGPELDWAIAKTIGAEGSILGDVCVDESFFRLGPWNPSTDLNAAFAAAENAGMFLELMRLASGWMATTYLMHGTYGYGDEPALAICAAILMLKKPVEVSE